LDLGIALTQKQECFEVRREGDNLMVMPACQLPAQLFHGSEVKLFVKAVDARFSFVKDSAGVVTGLIFHSPRGQNITGTKIR